MNKTTPFRYSRQREKIFDILKNNKNHPTADEIYGKVRETFPSISLGTVYRNLGVLHEQGLVNRIIHAEGPDRYDADMYAHSHFYCKKCGTIYDIEETGFSTSSGTVMNGHRVDYQNTSYYGVCSECLKKNH